MHSNMCVYVYKNGKYIFCDHCNDRFTIYMMGHSQRSVKLCIIETFFNSDSLNACTRIPLLFGEPSIKLIAHYIIQYYTIILYSNRKRASQPILFYNGLNYEVYQNANDQEMTFLACGGYPYLTLSYKIYYLQK